MESHSIEFEPVQFFDDYTETVVYPARIGKRRIRCRISMEALSDRFGASLRSEHLSESMIERFMANRQRIEDITRAKFRSSQLEGDGSVLIRSADII